MTVDDLFRPHSRNAPGVHLLVCGMARQSTLLRTASPATDEWALAAVLQTTVNLEKEVDVIAGRGQREARFR